jgi:hypothetical protein
MFKFQQRISIALSPACFRTFGGKTSQIDGFAVRPDLDKPGFFDNAPNHAIGFWGVYGVLPLTKSITLDAYYLGLDRKAAFNRSVAHEVRHSIGARLSRPVAQTKPGRDFDHEALWAPQTSGHGRWHQKPVTGFRPLL